MSGIKIKQRVDKKGNPIFETLGAAYGYIRQLKNMLKKRAKAEKFPVTTATPKETARYLKYAISMLEIKGTRSQREKITMLKNLLVARAQGYSIEGIAMMSGCHIDTAKKWEREALDRVKDAIQDRMKRGIPVLGSVN